MNGALLASKIVNEWYLWTHLLWMLCTVIHCVWMLFASSCDVYRLEVSVVPNQSQAAPRDTTRGRYIQTILHVAPKISPGDLSLITLSCIKSELNMQIYQLIPITHNHWEHKCSEIKDVYNSQQSWFVVLRTKGRRVILIMQ